MMLAGLKSAVEGHDPYARVTSLATLSTLVASSMAEARLRAWIAGIFGTVALGLSILGLSGLAMRTVSERRRELGLRIAIGADQGHIVRLVLRDSAATLALGLLAGLPLSYAVSQAARSLLFGVSPARPDVWLVAGATLALATLLATLPAAVRASRIDPMVTLRE